VALGVEKVSQTSVLQRAWKAGQAVQIHGWVYSLSNGILKNLDISYPKY
jgi:carbonic anhydrase